MTALGGEQGRKKKCIHHVCHVPSTAFARSLLPDVRPQCHCSTPQARIDWHRTAFLLSPSNSAAFCRTSPLALANLPTEACHHSYRQSRSRQQHLQWLAWSRDAQQQLEAVRRTCAALAGSKCGTQVGNDEAPRRATACGLDAGPAVRQRRQRARAPVPGRSPTVRAATMVEGALATISAKSSV